MCKKDVTYLVAVPGVTKQVMREEKFVGYAYHVLINVMVMMCLPCSSVHGFQRTSLLVDETASQQTIEITLDIKGNTIRETVSPRIVELNFSLTCRDSSNGGVQPQAIGEP